MSPPFQTPHPPPSIPLAAVAQAHKAYEAVQQHARKHPGFSPDSLSIMPKLLKREHL